MSQGGGRVSRANIVGCRPQVMSGRSEHLINVSSKKADSVMKMKVTVDSGHAGRIYEGRKAFTEARDCCN